MKNLKVLKSLLTISGLIASGIGAAILLAPVAFYATYGIELGDNFSLLNETRASGGALFASGIFIMSGAFIDKLAFPALVLSSLLYLSYGVSRMISIAIDGMPAEGLIQAIFLEMLTGLVCVLALVKYRNQITHKESV